MEIQGCFVTLLTDSLKRTSRAICSHIRHLDAGKTEWHILTNMFEE